MPRKRKEQPPAGVSVAKDGTWRSHGKWVSGTPSPNPKGRGYKEDEVARIRAVQQVYDPQFTVEMLEYYKERWRKSKRDEDRDFIDRHLARIPQNLEISVNHDQDLPDLDDDAIRELLAGESDDSKSA